MNHTVIGYWLQLQKSASWKEPAVLLPLIISRISLASIACSDPARRVFDLDRRIDAVMAEKK
jgi:hypothetical protein